MNGISPFQDLFSPSSRTGYSYCLICESIINWLIWFDKRPKTYLSAAKPFIVDEGARLIGNGTNKLLKSLTRIQEGSLLLYTSPLLLSIIRRTELKQR